MSYLTPSTSSLHFTKTMGQGLMRSREFQQQSRPHTTSIHILDDDSLLDIFYLYRPAIFDGDELENIRIQEGSSASYLGLSLVCTIGTPVAGMLAHSPLLPLIIDYLYLGASQDIGAEEEEIIFALKKRDRIRRFRIRMPSSEPQKLIMAFDEEYPVSEYLVLAPPLDVNSTALRLPETFQAPYLRQLLLLGFALPTGSRLLTTAVDLFTLTLAVVQPTTYFQPNVLLQWLSFLPRLESFALGLSFTVPMRDLERQLTRAPVATHVTLPNLRWFAFEGGYGHMEAVLRRITAPRPSPQDIQHSVPQPAHFPRSPSPAVHEHGGELQV